VTLAPLDISRPAVQARHGFVVVVVDVSPVNETSPCSPPAANRVPEQVIVDSEACAQLVMVPYQLHARHVLTLST
jgi:hypothetical protein